MTIQSNPKPTSEARKRDPEKRRRELLLAARHEFAEHGLSGARVDDIVNRAGVNKQLMYYYFGDKESLYEKVLEQAYIDKRKGEDDLELSAMPARDAMEKFIGYSFEFVRQNREFVSLVNDENLHLARHLEGSSVVQKRHVTLEKVIGDVLERGYAEGVFKRRVDPVDLYFTISSLSYFYFSNIHTMSKIFNRDLSAKKAINKRRGEIIAIVLSYLMHAPEDIDQV